MLGIFFWIIVIAYSLFHEINSANKNLHIEIESFNICPDNEKLRYPIRDLHFNRVNGTHSVLSMKVNYMDDIGDNVWNHMLLYRWGNGGWVNVPFLVSKNPCKMGLRYFPDIWINYLKALGVETPNKCPVPKGNYSLENFLIPTQTINIPMWTGRFRINTIWTSSRELKDALYCIEVAVTFKEK